MGLVLITLCRVLNGFFTLQEMTIDMDIKCRKGQKVTVVLKHKDGTEFKTDFYVLRIGKSYARIGVKAPKDVAIKRGSRNVRHLEEKQ